MIDKLITEIDKSLKLLSTPQSGYRIRPDQAIPDSKKLAPSEKLRHAKFMRVNHAGEVCAQGLYRGQLLFNKNPQIKSELEKAAHEEIDHLVWCEKRIDELGGRKSLLNPILYFGSFALGGLASIVDEKYNLGFLSETEKQVSSHLESHLAQINPEDKKTLEILKKMKDEEEAHQISAINLGAKKLPKIIQTMMKKAAKLMAISTYHI